MELTEEQKERIRANRERAFAIQRQRRRKLLELSEEEEGKVATAATTSGSTAANGGDGPDNKRLKKGVVSPRQESPPTAGTSDESARDEKKEKTEGDAGTVDSAVAAAPEEDVELEEFEIGASEWVTKTEASKLYCLPEGTLAVCQYREKPNPRNAKWTPLKLYSRSEIRRRARERYGGLDGLREERNRRAEKKYRGDLERTKNVLRS